jgi:hypothetical protein
MTGALKAGRKKLQQDVGEGNSVVRVLAFNGAFQAEVTSYFAYDKPHVTLYHNSNIVGGETYAYFEIHEQPHYSHFLLLLLLLLLLLHMSGIDSCGLLKFRIHSESVNLLEFWIWLGPSQNRYTCFALHCTNIMYFSSGYDFETTAGGTRKAVKGRTAPNTVTNGERMAVKGRIIARHWHKRTAYNNKRKN